LTCSGLGTAVASIEGGKNRRPPVRILYAIDVLEEEGWLLDEVGSWAKMLGATVDLIYVDTLGDGSAYVLDGDVYRMLQARLVEEQRRVVADLEDLSRRLHPDVRGGSQVLVGHPVEKIVALAVQYDAVAIGTHGRTGVGRALLGSTAERVVRRSPVTTIVLRRRES